MNQTKKSPVHITLKMVSCVFLIAALLFVFYLLFLYQYAEASYKTKRLDNPIVNERYAGWKEISLDDIVQVKIPEEWSVEFGSRIRLLDEFGDEVAIGIRGTDQFGDPLGVLCKEYRQKTSIVESTATRDFRTSYTSLFWNNGYSAKLKTTFDDGSESEDIFAELKNERYKDGKRTEFYYFIFYFPTDNDVERAKYFDIAEAIAWSMTYSDKPLNSVLRRCLNLM